MSQELLVGLSNLLIRLYPGYGCRGQCIDLEHMKATKLPLDYDTQHETDLGASLEFAEETDYAPRAGCWP